MIIWLIDDEEKFMKALARTAHREMFISQADEEMMKAAKAEEKRVSEERFTKTLEDIKKVKPNKDPINWAYLEKHEPKRYKKELKKREQELKKVG